jgi:hypothetical protein
MQAYVSKKSMGTIIAFQMRFSLFVDDWHLHSSSGSKYTASQGVLSPTSSHPSLTVAKPHLYHSLTPTLWNRKVDEVITEEVTMGYAFECHFPGQ